MLKGGQEANRIHVDSSLAQSIITSTSLALN